MAIQCPKCGSENLKKDGAIKGQQRWACLDGKIKSRKPSGELRYHWRGTAPIGIEERKRRGINLQAVFRAGKLIDKATRLVVTTAQNATPVHEPFLKALLSYCSANNAQLVVIPVRYKNPTSRFSEQEEDDDWWDEPLSKYLYNRRRDITPKLTLLADIMTQPTASSPLMGFETVSGSKSAILGHTKLQLKCVPTPQARLPKILTTTGAVTKPNYTESKAGKKGEFHHTFGAALVELKGKKFHLRQLNAMPDGSFMDLDAEYKPDGSIERGIALEYLNMGDTHEEFVSPQVVTGTFGKGGIVPTLKPKILFWHDLHDFYSRNHHHRGDPFTSLAKHRGGMENVKAALQQTFRFLDTHTPIGTLSVVVNSNHPNAFSRWIKETDWKSDPVNAEFYLETALVMARASKMTDIGASTIDPFVHWGKQWLQAKERVQFLSAGTSFMVKGVENTYHGHRGPNGAKGSIAQFDKIGVRSNIQHRHTPGIEGGVFQGGTSTPTELEYTVGSPGSWLNTHIAGYRNGKRTLINIIDGEWRA